MASGTWLALGEPMRLSVASTQHTTLSKHIVPSGPYGIDLALARMAARGRLMRLPVHRIRMRPWISMVLVYALALQVVFTGILIGQLGAASIGSTEFSSICLSHSRVADADGTGSGQLPSTHDPICIHCTLAAGPATLPDPATPVILHFARPFARQGHGRDMVVAFVSPTGRYQRGPPAVRPFAG